MTVSLTYTVTVPNRAPYSFVVTVDLGTASALTTYKDV
jgi:hypothetical protein